MATEPIVPLCVDEFECAKAIGMSVSWLRKDRANKRIVPFFKLGDCVRYNLDRVREALLALEQGGPQKRKK